ncbi:MAG: hypothetical protein QXU02_04540, partial [Candidatus Bathyarchaeia archaeon]
CSFCAVCQDECPTQAVRLTREYHLATNNRQATMVSNEVDLLSCAICGGVFFPEKQIDWALKRVTMEKVPAYSEFSGEILNAMRICVKCRRSIGNIREAKRLLSKLSEKVRLIS